jgi:hypothetical protein
VVVTRFVLACVPAALTISACDNASPTNEFASYDDCIIATVSDAPNADAIDVLTASCARKFEREVDLSLMVRQAVGSDTEISVRNDTEFIVTKVKIDAGDLGAWAVEDWIEPGSFVDIQTPKNAREVNAAVEKGAVTAKAFRAIPVKTKQ